MNRTLSLVTFITCLLIACGGSTPTSRTHVLSQAAAAPVTIDLQANPNWQFRVDAFSVPAASRSEFETTMHENASFLATMPGFKGHVVFEKTAGPSTFNIVTIAAWESAEAMKNAGEKVREDYQRTGFDMQGTIARWGVTASLGGYSAPKGLQGGTAAGVSVPALTIDLAANPKLQFRLGAFAVPAASRSELEKAMHENADFLARQPGFKGHVVFEKTGGPTTFNIVVLAAWESPEAMKNAGEKVRDYYQSIGFDMMGAIARWGVTASDGSYDAPAGLQ